MVAPQISKMVGTPLKRREDPRLLAGEGKFTDDIQLSGMVYMAELRSVHANARIRSVDVSRAASHPSVLGVLTGRDVRELCASAHPVWGPREGTKIAERWSIATDRVSFVGEVVAAVVAGTREAARDAVELIEVDYEPLPAVVDAEAAEAADYHKVHDELGTNVCMSASGAAGDVDGALARADHVVSLRLSEPRIVVNPMEPRAVVASYERGMGNLVVWDTSQTPHLERTDLSRVLGLSENKVRIIAQDVGGGFGCKVHIYPESVLTSLFSMRLGRPVKWVEERGEHFISTIHGRGEYQRVEAGFSNDGTLLGMRLDYRADLGAYTDGSAHYYLGSFTYSMAPGVYRARDLSWTVGAIYTNKVPLGPYRGYGRQSTAMVTERVMDLMAARLDMDPVEIRRKNLIRKEQFPYSSPTGLEYDSGDYEGSLNVALRAADYAGLRKEQARLRQQGVLMGIGVATTTERTGSAPSTGGSLFPGYESATIRMEPTGKVSLLTGSSPHGQGMETTLAQLVSDLLQVPYEDVEVIHGDTAIGPRGVGTFGSRSMVTGGSAALEAGGRVKDRAKEVAAALLRTDSVHVTLEGGKFSAEDIPDRTVTWAEVAKEAHLGRYLPADLERGLESTAYWEPKASTFTFSAHVAVVIVDGDTGEVRIDRYTALEDCGKVINPLVVDGQVHGGLAQGIGAALLEEAAYDESGQLVTGSLMDYAVPFADEFPMFTMVRTETPTPHNVMGAKGSGEEGLIASTPAVVNAVVDALSHLGVTHIDIPVTSEKVWRALRGQSA